MGGDVVVVGAVLEWAGLLCSGLRWMEIARVGSTQSGFHNRVGMSDKGEHNA